MKKLLDPKLSAVGILTGVLLASACSPVADDINGQISESLGQAVVIDNVGDSALEGHTPIGFAGSGTGLFAGDNLNANFPEGEGVQLFLAFPLPDDLAEPVTATLSSEHATLRGTPFEDLTALRAAPVQFDAFGPEVFLVDSTGPAAPCIPSLDATAAGDNTSGSGNGSDPTSTVTVSCEVTEALLDALANERDHLQLRLRFDVSGDGDGVQDMVLFFISDSNTNEPGIFTLTLE